jgi:hypothetical protein
MREFCTSGSVGTSGRKRPGVAPMILLLAFVATAALAFQLGVWLSPPVTSGGQPVMPIGHVLLSTFLGVVAAAILSWICWKRKRRNLLLEAWVLHGFGVALLVSFLVDRLPEWL